MGTVCCLFEQLPQSVETGSMKNEAGKALEKKLASVEGEQGAPKEAGSEPPANFGHGSATSAGVSGSIPKES
jgi:hypothetical protein